MGQFSIYFQDLRRETGLSLRKFCAEHGLDPGNISKLERGKIKIPGSDILEKYALHLGLKKGDSEWFRFFDLAAAERGEIPEDIMQDDDLAEKLPVVFRTLRGKELTMEDLEALAEKIRERS